MTVGSFNYGEAPAKQEYGQSVDGYDRIQIEMIQTQHPQTYVKLVEIDFGLTYALTGEQTPGGKG